MIYYRVYQLSLGGIEHIATFKNKNLAKKFIASHEKKLINTGAAICFELKEQEAKDDKRAVQREIQL